MSRKQEEQKKRKMLLELEYPDLVSKLALLLGGRNDASGAFRKIAGAYGQKRTQNKTAEMPAYEEMLVACRQMESGVGNSGRMSISENGAVWHPTGSLPAY